MDAEASSALILLIGGCLVWLMYRKGLREFVEREDDHGVNVTLAAMLGSFMPIIFFAALPWVFIHP